MKRIRTKLILTFLIATLIPVFPAYFLVKNLLQQSIEVGYNENVEKALESATKLSRELFAKYKHETLSLAIDLANLDWVQSVFTNGTITSPDTATIHNCKLNFYNTTGQLLNSLTAHSDWAFPTLFQTSLSPLSKKTTPQLIDGIGRNQFILAFAPVHIRGKYSGFIVLMKRIEPKFQHMFKQVIKVNQMFKTLNFFETDLASGFILSFLVIYLPIAALSVGFGIHFARKITHPLVALVQGAQKVAEGNWDTRIQVTTKDEIADVAVAFNQMVSTLKEKQEQVISLEKMAAWREIARVLAHEIKNPLTPIQLTVQQIKDKYPGRNASYQKLLDECTDIIYDEIESLRTLVREFSDFAKMPKLNIVPGDINELVEDVTKLYPNVNCSLHSSSLETSFDYEKMRRVLINLLDNGLDSIREKGRGQISLQTSVEDSMAMIIYSDTGNGIAEDLQKKVFEPYFSTKKSGMGLGLAIVKRIIIEHGGTISLQSSPGDGTTFIIKIPFV